MDQCSRFRVRGSTTRPFSHLPIAGPSLTVRRNLRCDRLTTFSEGKSSGFLSNLQGLFNKGDGDTSKRQMPPQRNAISAPSFPPYTVVVRQKEYDIRLYDVYPVVEMEYQRREVGYALLGGYIDGENAARTQFAYTQPTVMRYEPSGRKTMQMFVTAVSGSSAVSALPPPVQSDVSIAVAGGELIAVLQFEGAILPATAEAARQRLMELLKADGVSLADAEREGTFRVGQYGALNSLMPRLNEIMLAVKA